MEASFGLSMIATTIQLWCSGSYKGRQCCSREVRSKTNENKVRLPCILMNGTLLGSTAVLCHLTRMIGDENTVDRSFQRYGPNF
jgi:hypothetical protein